jgi:hypothetical protein
VVVGGGVGSKADHSPPLIVRLEMFEAVPPPTQMYSWCSQGHCYLYFYLMTANSEWEVEWLQCLQRRLQRQSPQNENPH